MKVLGYEINKAAAGKAPTSSVGFVGLSASSGRTREEFLSALQWPAAGKVYLEMSSNDAVVGGCLYLIESLVRKAKWHVVPGTLPDGKEGDKSDERVLFIQSAMDDMDESWGSFICEVLSMLPYGFSFHEIQYKVRRGPLEKDKKFYSKYSDGKIGWRAMPIRSQATLQEWTFDPATGEAMEFVQDLSNTEVKGGMGAIKIPLAGNLLFKVKSNRGNPEGFSLLRRAYRSWFFKKYMEELEGIGVERQLAGIPVIQPDENTNLFDPDNADMVALRTWAQNLVSGLRQDRNHGVVLPFGWELKLLAPAATNALDTDKIIHRYDARIAMTMLADLVLIGSDGTGSFALADTKKSLLTCSLEALLNSICEVLNKVAVPQLLIYNGETDLSDMPRIVADDIETPTIKELALLLRAVNIDLTSSPELFNFVMRIASGPELSEADLKLIADAAAAKEASKKPTDPNGGLPQDQTTNELKQSDAAMNP